jgi:hypothetical protein
MITHCGFRNKMQISGMLGLICHYSFNRGEIRRDRKSVNFFRAGLWPWSEHTHEILCLPITESKFSACYPLHCIPQSFGNA